MTSMLVLLLTWLINKECKNNRNKYNFEKYGYICPKCGYNNQNQPVLDYSYYFCSQIRDHKCHQPKITGKQIDAQVNNFLDQMTIGPAVSKWMIKMLKKEDGQATDILITQREQISKEISSINARLKRLKDRFESPANADNELYSDQEYIDKKNVYQKQIEMLQDKLESLNESSRTCLEAFVTGLELIKRAKQIIADKDATQEKKQILYFLCSNPTIDNGKISFNPSKLAQVFLYKFVNFQGIFWNGWLLAGNPNPVAWGWL